MPAELLVRNPAVASIPNVEPEDDDSCEGCGAPATCGAWYEDECRVVKMCGRCGA